MSATVMATLSDQRGSEIVHKGSLNAQATHLTISFSDESRNAYRLIQARNPIQRRSMDSGRRRRCYRGSVEFDHMKNFQNRSQDDMITHKNYCKHLQASASRLLCLSNFLLLYSSVSFKLPSLTGQVPEHPWSRAQGRCHIRVLQ